jgi:LmbE family N-acetylglucosaminyl deacetylase
MHGGQIVTAATLVGRALEARGRGALFVGAHPDDETFALGGQLGLMPNIEIMIVTNGSPRDLRDAHQAGFDNAERYAAARREELAAALAEAGIPLSQLTMLDVVDQQACQHLVEIAQQIATHLAEHRIGLVLTHAYEGGHPDHDAVALAVRAASRLLQRQGAPAPPIVEMPFYRASGLTTALQDFVPADNAVHEVELTAEQQARKRRLIACHKSQLRLLGNFTSSIERFRVAPDYDFCQLPNDGNLLYESWQLGITGTAWLQQARTALVAMGIEP